MKRHAVTQAQAIDDHRLSVGWADGLTATVDLSDLIDGGGPFEPLRDPARFANVRIYEHGHTIYWLDESGTEIDVCPDVLRARVDPGVAAWIADEERRWAARPAAE